MSGAPTPSERPGPAQVDEIAREQGLHLATLISAVIRIGRAYSVTNQVFRTQLANISAALRPVLDQAGEAVFVALESDLYLNGVRVPVSLSSYRFQRTVLEAFKSRAIAGIRVERAVAIDDLAKFFSLFLQPTCPHGPSFLKACADAGLQRVLPAIHASTLPTTEDDVDGGWEGESSSAADGDSPREFQIGGRSGGTRSVGSKARRHYLQAFDSARSVLTSTALNGGLEMRHAKRVVQPLVDGAFADEPIVIGLTTLREHDEFTYSHAVNVCAVAVTLGHFLSLDRRTLADLGVAALLHDAGKEAVAAEIVHPLEAFTTEERAAAERHPLEGAKLIAASTSLNATTLRCIRVALEHHQDPERPGGFPDLGPDWKPSLLSQIVSLADCYVNLHTRRGELIEKITPYEALGMVLGPFSYRFEPALLWALIMTLGFYPPGQFVELDDNSIALVLAPNQHDPSRPHVRVLIDAAGRRLPGTKHRELLPIPPSMRVRRALPGAEYPTMEAPEKAA